MKKIEFIIILGFSLLTLKYVQAQNEIDALRYSSLLPNGTARYLGIGGAFGAVGADFSTLSTNPAGIALYKSSEFSFTPLIFNGNTSSNYLGSSNSDNKFNINLGNLGLVFASKTHNSDNNGFKNFQFGFGINNTANFNNRVFIQGYNSKTSLMTDWTNVANAEHANPDNLAQFDTQLAYQTYLINPVSTDNTKYTSPLYNGNMLQKYTANTYGSSNEAVVSGGANYNDKLYIGATIGIPYFNYEQKSNYSETDINNLNSSVYDFNLYDHLNESGVGINIKFGLIYRVTDWLRLGAAVHSPSFYQVDRSETRDMTSDLYNGSSYEWPWKGNENYNLQTPAHYIGSAAIVIGKYGLVDVDYEYVDFSTMKLRNGDQYDFTLENQTIKSIYTGQHNIRIGGELKLNPFMLRAGFDFSTSPFANTNYQETKSISAGLGYRDTNYFVDFGFMHTFFNDEYYLYNPISVAPSINTINTNVLSMTNRL